MARIRNGTRVSVHRLQFTGWVNINLFVNLNMNSQAKSVFLVDRIRELAQKNILPLATRAATAKQP